MITSRLRTVSLLCLVCLASSVRAQDQVAPIHDDAKMFHDSAIDRAEQEITNIRRTFERGLFVRTVASPAPQPSRWLPQLRTPRVNRMLEEQDRTFAEESGAPGVYVLICKRPRDVHVVIWPPDDAELNRHDAENLRQSLLRDLHDKSADDALFALVDRLQDILQDRAAHGSSPVINDIVLAGLLGGGLALWLLLRLIRRRIRAGDASEQGTLPHETPASLGTMFGFPAGLWIYDKIYPYSKSQISDAS
ncbi:MAG TPA: hypothetical protein VH592_22770 [Gemmataceae bacterium]